MPHTFGMLGELAADRQANRLAEARASCPPLSDEILQLRHSRIRETMASITSVSRRLLAQDGSARRRRVVAARRAI